MSSATAATEPIPDEDQVSRLLDWPSMYGLQGKGFLEGNLLFTFPGDQPESLVWRKYAPADADVHAIGCEREARKRAYKPNARYTGFRSSQVGAVREFRNRRGHGFSLAHGPSEGIHHAEVAYLPASGPAAEPMRKLDRTELKVALSALFSAEVSHACQGET